MEDTEVNNKNKDFVNLLKSDEYPQIDLPSSRIFPAEV